MSQDQTTSPAEERGVGGTVVEAADLALAADSRPAPTTSKRRIPVTMTGKLATGLVIVGVIALVGIVGPFLLHDPAAIDSIGLQPPGTPGTDGSPHLLGTTQTGQDVLTQLVHATRGSLTIGLVVGVLAMVLASLFGVVGAYIGGMTDEAFSLFTNVVLVIPGLPLVIVISSYVSQRSVWIVALVLVITSWAGAARVIRGVTLSVRNRDYVMASVVAGERTWRILAVEILPNLLPLLASQFIFAVIAAILGEAGLSFLGLGAVDSWTWGTMLYYAQNSMALLRQAWWWFIPPGLMLALFGAGLSLINFAIDETINPKLRSQTRSSRKAWNLTKEQASELKKDTL